MARFPKIDQPCPLDRDGRMRARGGHCGYCGKVVHRLDGKTDAERAELLRTASGPVCVSYGIAAGVGAALALSSLVAPVSAGEIAASTSLQSPPAVLPAGQGAPADSEDAGHLEMIFVGGVGKPGEAEWIDDGELPELPVRTATAQDLG